LKNFPHHDIATKYMKLVDSNQNMYGYMLAVDTKENHPGESTNGRKFYDALKMIIRATDLGKVKTVATLNAISTHKQQGEEARKLSSVKPSTCRISCGIEDPDDIIADLDQALDKI
ncbi:MAG: O-acetylhomoserine aminocarboxypropyltransferase/cysteine synthase, partial [Planctomycetes bacterium]|nr:O-acetylhomoserine aminocarboxypropyltransferase/cysteine synthase [Planctomycetota bacterium]